MKKLIIGRNNTCDIIIPDTSDLVSRKQAVLTYSLWGKMVLYDTSNNGTYVNGQKLDNGKGMWVTRKDKINFAQIAELDWNEVKDPYRKVKLLSVVFASVIVFASLLIALFVLYPSKNDNPVQEQIEIVNGKGATETTVKPQVIEEPEQQQVTAPKKKKKVNKNKKEKKITPEDIMSKDVNDKTPIVY